MMKTGPRKSKTIQIDKLLPSLKYAVSLQKLGSVQKAAQSLGVSTQLISYHMKRLEEMFDEPIVLYKTEKRKTELTPLGNTILSVCSNMLEMESKISEQMKNLGEPYEFIPAKEETYLEKDEKTNVIYLHHYRKSRLKKKGGNKGKRIDPLKKPKGQKQIDVTTVRHPGEIIREELVDQQGMRREFIANEIGVDGNYFRSILTKKYPLTEKIAKNLCERFHLSISEEDLMIQQFRWKYAQKAKRVSKTKNQKASQPTAELS